MYASGMARTLRSFATIPTAGILTHLGFQFEISDFADSIVLGLAIGFVCGGRCKSV